MWIYISIMCFFCFLGGNKGRSKYKLWCCALILFSIMAFKATTVGNDTSNYVYFFNRLNHLGTWIDPTSRFEIGYQIYTHLVSLLSNNPQVLFIVTALLCVGCITKEISLYSKNYGYSMFLFVSLRIFYFFLSGLRQSIATSIIFISYDYLKRKKYLKFVLLVLLATSFHYSALVFLLAIPLSRIKLTNVNIAKTIGVILVLYVFFTPLINWVVELLPNYYAHYMETEVFASGNLGNYLSLLIKISFIFFSYFTGYSFAKRKTTNFAFKEIHSLNENVVTQSDIYVNFMIAAAGISLLATRASILDRMEQYFWIFSILGIPDMICKIRNKNKRMAWYLLIAGFTLLYNVILLIFRPEWNAIVPYRFFWQ